MEARHLPIKLFSTRGREDLSATEGGGDSKKPTWVLGSEDLLAKSESLRGQFAELAEAARQTEDGIELPLVARVTIKEKALAKSYRGEIGTLFSPTGRDSASLIGVEEDLDLLVEFEGPAAVERAASRLESSDRYRVGISAVEEIKKFEPAVDGPPVEEGSLKVKLLRYRNERLNAQVARTFEARLELAGIPFKRQRYAPGLDIYKVRKDGQAIVERFAALHSMSPMPRASIGLSSAEPIEMSVPRKLTWNEPASVDSLGV